MIDMDSAIEGDFRSLGECFWEGWMRMKRCWQLKWAAQLEDLLPAFIRIQPSQKHSPRLRKSPSIALSISIILV